MKPASIFALTTAAVLVAASPSIAEHHLQDGRKLSGTLSGAAEIPGPGDADGTGTIEARVNPGQGEFCYTLTASGIAAATMAHIHTGAAGVSGPVAIALTAPSGGSSSGCVTIDKTLAQAIVSNPGGYYANVHNAEFPGGAVRGQLGK